ncbi:MAG: RNA polymerase sigma-70 factor [bacterium]|nr:RNA polymerase sigma-70 factor [bacterium]
MEPNRQKAVDTLLWRIAIESDEQAFKSLFERYYAALCLFAKRYIEELTVREDIVQEVFVGLWERRQGLDVNVSAENYLLTCVKNRCLNYLRHQEVRQAYAEQVASCPLYELDQSDEQLYDLQELEQLLADALERLPMEYRVAFEMTRLEGHSLEEVAIRLGVSVRTIERYRDKALAILQKELKDYLPLLLLLMWE